MAPDLHRRSSAGPSVDAKSSLPYPTFSKAHSREAVSNRQDTVKPAIFPYTPDATDLGHDHSSKSTSPRGTGPRGNNIGAPPSPPLTGFEPDVRWDGDGSGTRQPTSKSREDVLGGKNSVDNGTPNVGWPRFSASRTSLRQAEEGQSPKAQYSRSSPLFRTKSSGNETRAGDASGRCSPNHISPSRKSSTRETSEPKPITTPSLPGTESDATSVGPERKRPRAPPTLLSHNGSSPPSDNESSPRTPHPPDAVFPQLQANGKQTPHIEVFASYESESEYGGTHGPVVPPPPPPPDIPPADIPRVDYLLQNGGLPQPIPKVFASASYPPPVQTYQQYASPNLQVPRTADVQGVFSPYQKLLDGLSQVMAKNGSVAVATGYRSVARRLLDRLEVVFARNISREICRCIMCRSNSQTPNSEDEDTGVSWGEILELVSGRRELPQWPPFSLATSDSGLGISDLEAQAPMQKLDIDVPAELRDHYIRQSQKTKQAVHSWLACSSQPEAHASPPQEVDDETLTFAMLTYLESEQRLVFAALTKGLSALPTSRSPTPIQTETGSDLMSRIGPALQRLYRLPKVPREPESSMYLLKNPGLHNVLATLAAISNSEWDILISGRFDGFLWSGAEDQQSGPPGRGPSRGPNATPGTPFSRTFSPAGGVPLPRGLTPFRTTISATQSFPPSRGTTPFSALLPGGPIHLDEDTEIAVLAEVEREIYLGMEALEDSFEALHLKAESVRLALRSRSAGLAVRAMERRGSQGGVEVRMGTPASGVGGGVRMEGMR